MKNRTKFILSALMAVIMFTSLPVMANNQQPVQNPPDEYISLEKFRKKYLPQFVLRNQYEIVASDGRSLAFLPYAAFVRYSCGAGEQIFQLANIVIEMNGALALPYGEIEQIKRLMQITDEEKTQKIEKEIPPTPAEKIAEATSAPAEINTADLATSKRKIFEPKTAYYPEEEKISVPSAKLAATPQIAQITGSAFRQLAPKKIVFLQSKRKIVEPAIKRQETAPSHTTTLAPNQYSIPDDLIRRGIE